MTHAVPAGHLKRRPLDGRAPDRVLKFGSSVLKRIDDFHAAAQEVYRHVRAGERVIVVVSALEGETDALFAQAEAAGGAAAPDPLVARLVRVGELRSAALMGLALARIGVRVKTLDPHEIELKAGGEALDSALEHVDENAVFDALDDAEVLVLPGYVADHAEHGLAVLGRGGTDLTAVFLAARAQAGRVRLLKDVDGIYADDPKRDPAAPRFAELDYDEALKASRGLVQDKAIRAAAADSVELEVADLGAARASCIRRGPARIEAPEQKPRLRVALLGCGAVGGGVLAHLLSRPDLFQLNPVLVRTPEGREAPDGVRFTASLDEALGGEPDLVIEALGGADAPGALMEQSLRRGAHVVTANKAAVAAHFERLAEAAAASGARFAYAAAVGGGAPALEAAERLRAEYGLAGLQGVMNGTANFILSRLEQGADFDAAVKEAQALGFAEADPSADVDGHDAADKLALMARAAFGAALDPRDIPKQPLSRVTPQLARDALAQGKRFKQIGSLKLGRDGAIDARVEVRAVDLGHPLAGAANEENRFRFETRCGQVCAIYGKGAGRWPTAAAVFADVMDAAREAGEKARNARAGRSVRA